MTLVKLGRGVSSLVVPGGGPRTLVKPRSGTLTLVKPGNRTVDTSVLSSGRTGEAMVLAPVAGAASMPASSNIEWRGAREGAWFNGVDSLHL